MSKMQLSFSQHQWWNHQQCILNTYLIRIVNRLINAIIYFKLGILGIHTIVEMWNWIQVQTFHISFRNGLFSVWIFENFMWDDQNHLFYVFLHHVVMFFDDGGMYICW